MMVGMGYDPGAEFENSQDSAPCVHGTGCMVEWNRVEDLCMCWA